MKRLVLKTVVAAVALAAFGVASAQEQEPSSSPPRTPRATRW